MFRPRSIKFIFRAELLPGLGRLSEPDIRPFIEKYIADHAWLWGPTIYADIAPDGFVDLTFKGFHWLRSKRANAPHEGGDGAHYRECEPGETWVPGIRGRDGAREDGLLDWVIDPLTDADAGEACSYCGAVGPARRDAGNQRGARDAGQPVPPVQVLSYSRNACHPAIKSPRLAQVQK